MSDELTLASFYIIDREEAEKVFVVSTVQRKLPIVIVKCVVKSLEVPFSS